MEATDMADALTWVMRKVERSLFELPGSCKCKLEEVINELRIILDFLEDKDFGNGSRLGYYISDIADMVRDPLNINDDLTIYNKPFPLERWIKEVKTRMLKFKAQMKPDDVGVDGDGDDEEDVVGLEKDVELVLRKAIFNEEQGLQTSTIEGIVGIGKTTLARQVYNHADIVGQFECRAWVHVSSELSHKEVLMKLVQQVVQCEELERDSLLKKMEYADNRSIKEMLHRHLQGMRYFIVLDDWPEEMWLRSILEDLQHGDNGSRMLLTGRCDFIQETIHYHHRMKYLDSNQSWKLFSQTVFGGNKFTSEHKLPKHLESRVRELSVECGGMPLAIKHVGRQLAEKRQSGIEWQQLLESIDFSAILEILEPRYQKLDPLVKSCFLHLVFLKEKTTVIKKLMQLIWVAGGMTKEISNMDSYLQQLIKESVTEHFYGSRVDEIINELRIILDLLRDNKVGNGSKLRYHISDIADMFRESLNTNDDLTIYDKPFPLERWVKEVKTRVLKSEAEMKPHSHRVNGERRGTGDEEDVVGLEDDVEVVLRRAIFNEEQGLQTSTIEGIVGIGKTTLARQVYNHADIVGQFECRAWVHVSSELSHKEVLMKLVQQVVQCEELERDSLLKAMEHADNRIIKQMLHRHLQGMRYFIVLDDWPEEMWLRSILKGLPRGDKGSRLLVTGRFDYIQETIHYHHGMKYLDPNKSWKLLTQTIFGDNKFTNENKLPKHLESRAKELSAECGGLPLAIKHVGRQIAEKRQSGMEWEKLLESIDYGEILEILEPSYQKLDPMVKSCFLHLAFFKEKTTLRKQKLMHLIWAAGEMPAEEIRNIDSYLQQLVKESIIEVKSCPIKKFHVNALLHKLSTKKAEEGLGFEMVRNNGSNRFSQSPRHRAIYCSRDEFNHSTGQDKHIVSLFFRGGGRLDASPSYWKSFKILEILDLEDFGMKVLPESIDTLKELKYLGLRNNYIKELPRTLGRLKKLEVLDIALNPMVEMPDIIWEMDSLCHIYMSNVICPKHLSIGKLRNLVTITDISVENWNYAISRMGRMTGFRNLGIEEVDGSSNLSKVFHSFSRMKGLDKLTLKGFRFKSMPSLDKFGILHRLHTLKVDGHLARLPSANNFPQNICSLKFVNSSLDVDPMPVLEKLPKLKYLKLRNAYTGRQMVILHDGFPELKVMCIEESWNLRDVQIGEGAMPRLKKLEIKNSPELETLPEEIWSMAGLEELNMVTTKRIATKIKELRLISKVGVMDINP